MSSGSDSDTDDTEEQETEVIDNIWPEVLLFHLKAAIFEIAPYPEDYYGKNGKMRMSIRKFPTRLLHLRRNDRLTIKDKIIEKVRSLHRDAGIVHRNLNEENIIIDGDDVYIMGYERAKWIDELTDFDFKRISIKVGRPIRDPEEWCDVEVGIIEELCKKRKPVRRLIMSCMN